MLMKSAEAEETAGEKIAGAVFYSGSDLKENRMAVYVS